MKPMAQSDDSLCCRYRSCVSTGDVLKEEQWNLLLSAQLNEVCTFERRFGEEDTVVAQNTHGIPVNASET